MSFFPKEGGGGLFKQGAFQIDPNSTPEMLERKREMLAAMMPQYGKAKYVGEGIGQLFQGIATGRKNKAMDKFEGERSQEAAGAYNNYQTGQGAISPRSSGPLSVLGMRPDSPAAQPSPNQDVANDTMDALGMPRQGGYRESLIGTESGGNFAAQNNEVGAGGKRGHFGRVQFGQARLKDAMNAGAIPQGTTPEQFMASPEMQVAAENWHFADLEKQLSPYVGTEVDGKPLDLGALVAMGHLGGAAGAKRYVETGGGYNPSDSFGTSLSDYAQKHGGGSFAPGQGQQVAQNGGGQQPAQNGQMAQISSRLNEAMSLAQNVWLKPQQRRVLNSDIQQMQGQLQAMQERQWGREDFLWKQENTPQDPWAGTKVINGQVVRMGAGGPEAVGDFSTPEQGAAPLTSPADRAAWGIPESDKRPYAVKPGGVPQVVGGSGVTINNDLGGGKFEEAFAKGDAAILGTVSESGLAAQRNIGRIDQLEGLLGQSPTGFSGAAKLAAGEWGINTEGLSDIQAAQALINSLVPEQRQPGSGPMSDADLALFKQSLPRIINQPGGNATIVQTMRAIAQYDAEGAAIVQQLRSGDIDRATAFSMLQGRENPMSKFKAPPKIEGGTDADDAAFLKSLGLE